MRSQSARGFTLLEVIVALTLAATLGIAIFSWISSTLSNIERIESHTRRETAVANTLGFIQTINPMLQPQGEQELGLYRIEWSAHLVAPIRKSKSLTINDAPGSYEIGLYTVQTSVFEGKVLAAAFNLQLAGYRQLKREVQGEK